MPTVIQNARSTATFTDETRRTRDVTPQLAHLQPDAGPLVTLLTRLRKQGATDPKIEWFEDDLLPRFDVLGGSLTAAATTMTVTNYKYFRAGDLVRVNKQEIIRVTTTPTSTTVAIQRSFGETGAKAASSGDQLHILSNTNMEGATKRSFISTQKQPQYNYCQIIRDPFGITNTAKVTKTYAGMDWDQASRLNLVEHKKNLEFTYLLGERKEDTTTSTYTMRASRGIVNFLSTNVLAVGGDLTEAVFDNFMRQCFRYGEKTKLFFGAGIVMQAINGFAKERLRTVEKSKSYGISLSSYHMAGKTLLLHDHVSFENADINDFSGIGGMGLVLDLKDFKARYMKGRFTVHKMNIQGNDADAREDEHLSETGLEAHLEKKHGKLDGVTG